MLTLWSVNFFFSCDKFEGLKKQIDPSLPLGIVSNSSMSFGLISSLQGEKLNSR